MSRFAIGLAIAGVGNVIAKTGGIAWTFGVLPSAAQQAASIYEWRGGIGASEGLASLPKTVTTQAEPFDASLNVSAGGFELHFNDFAAKKLVFRESTTALFLTSAETATSDSIGISGPGNTGLAGTVVWVDNEAIGLGTHIGGGVYTFSARGLWSTPATRHRAGIFVYSNAPPFFRTRGCKLILINRDSGVERERWAGWLKSPPISNPTGVRLKVRCEERWSATFRAEVNRGALDLSRQAAPLFFIQTPNGVVARGLMTIVGSEPRVIKAAETFPIPQAVQVEQALFFPTRTLGNINFRPTLTDPQAKRAYGTSWLDIEFDDDSTSRLTEGGIWEVFAVVRDLDQDGDTDRHVSTDDFFSATRALTLPFHPLTIAFALLTSTYNDNITVGTEAWDGLAGPWGIGIPTDWIDTAAIAAVIAKTRAAKVDRLILGWDGNPVKLWETIRTKLLQPFGFFIGTTNEGKLTAATLKALNVEDVANAAKVTLLPHDLQWLEDPADGVNTVFGKVGGTPWEEGRGVDSFSLDAVNSAAPGDSLRNALFTQRQSIEIDYTARTDEQAVRSELLMRVKRGRFAMPRILVKVGDGDYSIGDYVAPQPTTLARPWFVDPLTGARVRILADDPRFMGQIIGRRWDTTLNTFILTLLLPNYRSGGLFATLVSPALEVTSAAGVTINCAATSQFGFEGADSTAFTSGGVTSAFVEVWKPDGTRRSAEARELDIAGATSLTLISAFTVTPLAGDIIRLAHLDDVDGFPETGDQTVPGFLAWVYMADASGEISPNDLPGHIYGDGLY